MFYYNFMLLQRLWSILYVRDIIAIPYVMDHCMTRGFNCTSQCTATWLSTSNNRWCVYHMFPEQCTVWLCGIRVLVCTWSSETKPWHACVLALMVGVCTKQLWWALHDKHIRAGIQDQYTYVSITTNLIIFQKVRSCSLLSIEGSEKRFFYSIKDHWL